MILFSDGGRRFKPPLVTDFITGLIAGPIDATGVRLIKRRIVFLFVQTPASLRERGTVVALHSIFKSPTELDPLLRKSKVGGRAFEGENFWPPSFSFTVSRFLFVIGEGVATAGGGESVFGAVVIFPPPSFPPRNTRLESFRFLLTEGAGAAIAGRGESVLGAAVIVLPPSFPPRNTRLESFRFLLTEGPERRSPVAAHRFWSRGNCSAAIAPAPQHSTGVI